MVTSVRLILYTLVAVLSYQYGFFLGDKAKPTRASVVITSSTSSGCPNPQPVEDIETPCSSQEQRSVIDKSRPVGHFVPGPNCEVLLNCSYSASDNM